MKSSNISVTSADNSEGATAIINHSILEGKEEAYQTWLSQIAAVCQTFPGYLDFHAIHPVRNRTKSYSLFIRFDTLDHLESWLSSSQCLSFVEKLQKNLSKKENIFIKSGIDFLFIPEDTKQLIPNRWKQFLVTWSAIYPISFAVDWALRGIALKGGLFNNHTILLLIETGFTVLIMVYLVMPRYTKFIKKWLYKQS